MLYIIENNEEDMGNKERFWKECKCKKYIKLKKNKCKKNNEVDILFYQLTKN